MIWLLVLAVGASLTVQVLSVFEATLAGNSAQPISCCSSSEPGRQHRQSGSNHSHEGVGAWRRSLLRRLARGRPRGAGGILPRFAAGCARVRHHRSRFWMGHRQPVIGPHFWPSVLLPPRSADAVPLLAKAIHADPAVFSNPFISTFTDATGLIIYFVIAKAVLGI